MTAKQKTTKQLRNSTEAIAKQRPASNNGNTVGSGVFYGLLRGYITRPTEMGWCSAVQCSAGKELAPKRGPELARIKEQVNE
jgi:hypothetical protein